MSEITKFLEKIGTPVFTSLFHLDIQGESFDVFTRDSSFPMYNFSFDAATSPSGYIQMKGIQLENSLTLECIESGDFKLKRYLDAWIDEIVDIKTGAFRTNFIKAKKNIVLSLFSFEDAEEKDVYEIYKKHLGLKINQQFGKEMYVAVNPSLNSILFHKDYNPIIQSLFNTAGRIVGQAAREGYSHAMESNPIVAESVRDINALANTLNAYTPINTSLAQFSGAIEKTVITQFDKIKNEASVRRKPIPIFHIPVRQIIAKSLIQAYIEADSEVKLVHTLLNY